MAFQAQTLSFTISGGDTTTSTLTANFNGNSITNNQVSLAIQSINVNYSDGNDDHDFGILECVPTLGNIQGTSVPVTLTARFSDKYDGNNVMSGTVNITVMADVN